MGERNRFFSLIAIMVGVATVGASRENAIPVSLMAGTVRVGQP